MLEVAPPECVIQHAFHFPWDAILNFGSVYAVAPSCESSLSHLDSLSHSQAVDQGTASRLRPLLQCESTPARQQRFLGDNPAGSIGFGATGRYASMLLHILSEGPLTYTRRCPVQLASPWPPQQPGQPQIEHAIMRACRVAELPSDNRAASRTEQPASQPRTPAAFFVTA